MVWLPFFSQSFFVLYSCNDIEETKIQKQDDSGIDSHNNITDDDSFIPDIPISDCGFGKLYVVVHREHG